MAPPEWHLHLEGVLRGTRRDTPRPLPDGHIVLARDAGPVKRYAAVPLSALARVQEALPAADRCLYAVQALCLPTHLFFDLERKGATWEDGLAMVGRLLDLVLTTPTARFLLLSGGDVGAEPAYGKVSFHLHVRDGPPFAHVGHTGVAARSVFVGLREDDRAWVDTTVYDRNRCFRLCGSSKASKPDGRLRAVPGDRLPERHRGRAAILDHAAEVEWSASVEVQGTPAQEQRDSLPSISVGGRTWDASTRRDKYDAWTGPWATYHMPGWAWPPREGALALALGPRLPQGARTTTGATMFWAQKGRTTSYRPTDVTLVWAAVRQLLRAQRPVLLNECVTHDELRHPWIDIDKIALSPEATAALLADVCASAVRALPGASNAIVTASSDVVQEGGFSVARAVGTSCHIRWPNAVVSHAEHKALLAYVRSFLRGAAASTIDQNVSAVRAVGSCKLAVDEDRGCYVSDGRPPLRIVAEWTEGRFVPPTGDVFDAARASVRPASGAEPTGTGDVLQSVAGRGAGQGRGRGRGVARQDDDEFYGDGPMIEGSQTLAPSAECRAAVAEVWEGAEPEWEALAQASGGYYPVRRTGPGFCWCCDRVHEAVGWALRWEEHACLDLSEDAVHGVHGHEWRIHARCFRPGGGRTVLIEHTGHVRLTSPPGPNGALRHPLRSAFGGTPMPYTLAFLLRIPDWRRGDDVSAMTIAQMTTGLLQGRAGSESAFERALVMVREQALPVIKELVRCYRDGVDAIACTLRHKKSPAGTHYAAEWTRHPAAAASRLLNNICLPHLKQSFGKKKKRGGDDDDDGPPPAPRATWEPLGRAHGFWMWHGQSSLEIVPPRHPLDLGTVNAFSRFAVLPEDVDSIPLSEAVRAMRPLIWHIYHRLCGDSVMRALFLWRSLAHIVQFPMQKLGMAHLFVGEEGSLKGGLVELLLALVGPAYSASFQDSAHAESAFNALSCEKAVLFFDETHGAESRRAMAVMKAQITQGTKVKRALYHNHEVVNDFASVFACANWTDLPMEARTRRWEIYEAVPELCETDDAVAEAARLRVLTAILGGEGKCGLPAARQRAICCFARVLYALDLSTFDPKKAPPGRWDRIAPQVLNGLPQIESFFLQWLRRAWDHHTWQQQMTPDEARPTPSRMWHETTAFADFAKLCQRHTQTQFSQRIAELMRVVPGTTLMVDIDASLSAFADRLGLSRKYVERSAYTRGPDEAFLAREAQAVATERVFGVTTVALERAWLHPEATEDDSTIAAAYQRRLARRAPVVEPRVRARPPESDGEATPLKRARSEELEGALDDLPHEALHECPVETQLANALVGRPGGSRAGSTIGSEGSRGGHGKRDGARQKRLSAVLAFVTGAVLEAGRPLSGAELDARRARAPCADVAALDPKALSAALGALVSTAALARHGNPKKGCTYSVPSEVEQTPLVQSIPALEDIELD